MRNLLTALLAAAALGAVPAADVRAQTTQDTVGRVLQGLQGDQRPAPQGYREDDRRRGEGGSYREDGPRRDDRGYRDADRRRDDGSFRDADRRRDDRDRDLDRRGTRDSGDRRLSSQEEERRLDERQRRLDDERRQSEAERRRSDRDRR